MDKAEQKKLRDDLEKEKEIILGELERIAVKNPVVKGDYKTVFPKAGENDTPDERAQNVTGYEEERAIEQNLELRLKAIDEALDKIDKNSYGICDKCSSPIGEKRLKAIPVARFCLDCAGKTKGKLI
jgi:RNA polymerase-binding transcription factor DksA